VLLFALADQLLEDPSVLGMVITSHNRRCMRRSPTLLWRAIRTRAGAGGEPTAGDGPRAGGRRLRSAGGEHVCGSDERGQYDTGTRPPGRR